MAVKHWDDYSQSRDAMLLATHSVAALWTDSRRHARVNLKRDILCRIRYASESKKLAQSDRNLVFEFTPDCLTSHPLAR